MARAKKLLKGGAGLATGLGLREGVEEAERRGVEIPEWGYNAIDAGMLYSLLSASLKKKLTPEKIKKLKSGAKKILIDKFVSPKALAKKAGKLGATAASGPFAPLVGLGFLGHEIYDVGKSLYNLGDRTLNKKRGGQIKKTKRKVHSKTRGKPRGVGKALRGYGAVSR